MKIILKSFTNEKQEKEYWIVVIDKGTTKSKKVDKDTFTSLVLLNKSISN